MGRFKQGKSGNPSGRPKLSEGERVIKQMTKDTFNDLCQKMMTCDKSELEAMLQGTIPYEAELFIRHMLSLGEKPDWHAYTKYLDRRIGPVKQELQVERELSASDNERLDELHAEIRTMLLDRPKDIECHGKRLDSSEVTSSPLASATGRSEPKPLGSDKTLTDSKAKSK